MAFFVPTLGGPFRVTGGAGALAGAGGHASSLAARGVRLGWKGLGVSWLAGCLVWLTGFAWAAPLPFSDSLAQRGVISGASGSGTGSNAGATRENNEPDHSRLPGGSSVWLSWVAPDDGLVTFSTSGSNFEGLVGVYAYEQALRGGPSAPKDPTKPFADLREVARAESNQGGTPQNPGFVTVGVHRGVEYELAVDGYAGAVGAIQFAWNFSPVDLLVPVIILDEPDRALRLGDSLQLIAQVTVDPDSKVKYQWLLNDQEISGQEDPVLVIPALAANQVGTYKLRLKAGRNKEGELIWYSPPVEIQINSEGQTNALARDRLFEALETPLTPDDKGGGGGGGGRLLPQNRRSAAPAAVPIGVARGYNGTQIFSTIYAARDPGEPLHCGLLGSASYWFAYQAPADGQVRIDTDGSTFDTILATYTYTPPLAGYGGLVPVVCDHSVGPGPGGKGSRVQFRATRAQTYLVVVDGFNGAKGNARLNYSLSTNPVVPPPVAPVMDSVPAELTVREGGEVAWSIGVSGTGPLGFSWWHEDIAVPGQTSTNLQLSRVDAAAAGRYRLVATNLAGAATSAPVVVRVLVSPPLTMQVSAAGAEILFPSAKGLRYWLEFTDDLGASGWHPLTNVPAGEPGVLVGEGGTLSLLPPPAENRFYRLHVE